MTQPGWYQDPAGGPALRWWDGGQWTGHQWTPPDTGPVAVAPAAASPEPPDPAPVPSAPVPQAATPPAQVPQAAVSQPTIPQAPFAHPQVPQAPVPPGPVPPGVASRRRFLWIAGASVLGLAAAGGITALAVSGDSQEPSAAPTGAPAPKATPPTWKHTLDHSVSTGSPSGGFGVLGDVVVLWDGGSTAQAFDQRTGAVSWTLPQGEPHYTWLGLFGSTLIGTTQDDNDADIVVGVGSSGKQEYSFTVGRVDDNGGGFTDAFDVGGNIALFCTSTGAGALVAVDLSRATQLWTRALSTFDDGVAVTDGHRCYLQDFTDTVCLDLTTGKQLWAASGTSSANDAPARLALVGDALAIAGGGLTLLDTGTGARRKTALGTTSGVKSVSQAAGLLVVGVEGETADGDDYTQVWGLNPSDGSKAWVTPIPHPLAAAVTTSDNLVLVPIAKPVDMETDGLLVLDGVTGATDWAQPGDGGRTPWLACATVDTVYAAGSSTIYAFPRR